MSLPKKCLKCPFKTVKELNEYDSKICQICMRDNLNEVVNVNEKLKGWGEQIRKDRLNDQKFILEIVSNHFAGNTLFSKHSNLDGRKNI